MTARAISEVVDVGRAIQGLGKTINPGGIEVTITKAQFMVSAQNPNKLGTMPGDLDNVVMEPVPAGK